jgi:hypothetical protein
MLTKFIWAHTIFSEASFINILCKYFGNQSTALFLQEVQTPPLSNF